MTHPPMQDADLPDRPQPPIRSAMVWGVLNFTVSQIGAFVVFLVLANTLDPVVFGVFAVAVVALDLVAVHGKYAMIDALVIGGGLTQRRLSNALWLGFILCAAAMAALGGVSLMVAPQFEMPDLAGVGLALSALLLLTPAQTVMEAQLFGRLQIRSLALRNIAMTLAGGVAGVGVALSDAPEWALVAQRGAQAVAATVLLWLATRFTPSFSFDRADAFNLGRRAGGIWRNFVFATLPRSVVQVAIGAQFGAAVLGVFRILERFTETVHQAIIGPLTNLIVPVVSRYENDPVSRADHAIAVMRSAAGLAVPAFVGLALLAKDVLGLVLSPEVASQAPVMQVIALMGVFTPLTWLRMPILGALKRNGLLTIQLMFDVAAAALAVWLLAPMGVFAVVCGLFGVAVIGAGFGLWSVALVLGVQKRRILAALGPAYLGASAMALAVSVAMVLAGPAQSAGLNFAHAGRVLLLGGFGAAIYLGYLWIVHRGWVEQVIASFRASGPEMAQGEPIS